MSLGSSEDAGMVNSFYSTEERGVVLGLFAKGRLPLPCTCQNCCIAVVIAAPLFCQYQ